ncbi:MAG TPA: hypothetical protein DCP40_12525 [Stenotrophomonas sp.]|nr:hypothetical protein [Stenotrophomonas sp.]
MNTTMADGASERLDAQIADALFGQPGMSKLDVANRLRELRGNGGALLGSAAYPAAWMWLHPDDGSMCFTTDGDVATEAANFGRAVSALYRVPLQEDAQPSPAGQAAGMNADDFANMVESEAGEYGAMLEDGGPYSGWVFSCEALIGFCGAIINGWGFELRAQQAAIAARQPVGQEPVGSEFAISRTMEDAEAASDGMLPAALVPVADEWYRLCERRFAVDRIRISGQLAEAIVEAVCAAPPAQAVDLGQFRPAVCALGLYAEEPEDVDEARRLLALIDSKAVGK